MTTVTASSKTFEQVYADAVIHDMTNKQWEEASKVRELQWHGKRMPLADAAQLYAKICDGYNSFRPGILAMLLAEFPLAGIEVTPAREGSPAVYLHLTGEILGIRRFIEDHWNADEVDGVTKFTCQQSGEADLLGSALRVWWD